MNFIHDDPEFRDLLTMVGDSVGIDRAMVEKDYWVTHTLWGLARSALEVWFKGGTSLAKGFGLIERFSEDLDLRIEPGGESEAPPVKSWSSMNRGAVRSRREFFEALEEVIAIPNAAVSLEHDSIDKRSRGARYRITYPGNFLADLGPNIWPFVLLEVGAARVTPWVLRPLSSFVHDWLDEHQQLAATTDNRPQVRCVHPLVTLVEKLDAISRRFARLPMEPETFIRHYEDAARIITLRAELPPLGIETAALIADMMVGKQIRHRPRADDPCWLLTDETARRDVNQAHQSISTMFWGKRIALEHTCDLIRHWISKTASPDRPKIA